MAPAPVGLTPPDYAGPQLADVLPAAALSLDAGSVLAPERAARAEALEPERGKRVVIVVLVDGLGAVLLRERAAHAAFLRRQLPRMREISAGFPSTTANSLTSLGTGLPPVGHGVLGYTLLDPVRRVVFNQLTWDRGPDPRTWVGGGSLFGELAGAGIDVVSLGEPKFAGRGLNGSALGGGRFRGSKTLGERVAQASAEAAKPGRRLIYLYWGALDKAGHGKGYDSFDWTTALEEADRELSRLSRVCGGDVLMTIVADHGMVDVAEEQRVDMAGVPGLLDGVEFIAGEPRARHIHTVPGAQDAAAQAFSELLGDRAAVLRRDEAIDGGWFGPTGTPPADEVRARIGDLVVVADEGLGLVDSGHDTPTALRLIGQHGSVSRRELSIPYIPVG
ncbi:alkaline phosphatase family protein [Brevibacterium sp. 50QC2O2]|jgi:hypothetical protein|uniref:alkaline phosphatase family protein n=1 Tax=unclassified Brevibacterium TaxID=2614124 RepID=UPI00211BD0AA|nr:MULTISPECIES: nucleotide pyrophosphatase/phosphodiesterase family protein [unclassified Brevibacterium]MCQ9368474.1 alkaline phosphatase family protein [Brevibacterium sp. 91QC2O2]MCQ9387388.1 alkaline phosphatase family protein [Brevibacterium sp. 50QC2O2]